MASDRLACIGLALVALACGVAPVRGVVAAEAPGDLTPLLKRACADGAVAPGGVAVVVRDGAIRAIGAYGRRVAGNVEALRVDDSIPLGALASPTTALVCALAVESGAVRWSTTLGDVAGDMAMDVDAGWRAATVAELASRRVAATEGVTLERLVEAAGGAEAAAPRLRDALLRLIGALAPKTPHGIHDPANRSGPSLAALVVERSARAPFEALARRSLFEPLALPTAKFTTELTDADKGPASGGHADDGTALPPSIPNARGRALAPAYGLRLSLSDAATLLATLADPARATSRVHVSTAGAEPLLRPVGGAPVVCGWSAERRPWARGLAYFSRSRGDGWASTAWSYPRRGYAILVALNRSSEAALDAAEALVEAVSSNDALSGG